MSAGKRYFEFSDGSSNKFWEVWIEGNQVFTRYGKIGASGQVTLKDEGSPAGAQKLFDKLVKEKTGKGYVEKGGGGAAPAAPAAPAAAKKAAPAPAPSPAKAAPAAKKAAPAPAAAPAAPMAGGTRRFEFTEGGSAKFWEVTVDGSAHTVRYGKIGTPGQEKGKSFGSEAAAMADAEKLIREKTGKGYAEVAGAGGADAGPPAPPLEPGELTKQFASIDKGGDSPDAYLVFADWLESKGHPWGKLIALQHGVATAPNAKKKAELEKEVTSLLQSQGAAILGDLSRAGRPTRFEWHYGFITEAIIASPTDKVVLKERLATLFSLPASRAIRKLTLHAQPARLNTHQEGDESVNEVVNPWGGGLGEALKQAPATLKELAFGDAPPTGAAAYVAMPNLVEVGKALPGLTHVELQGSGGDANGALAGKFAFPEATSFIARFAAPNQADLEAIAGAKLPKVQHLSVWLGGQAFTDLDSAGYDPYDNEDGDARYPETFPVSDLEKMEIYDVNPTVNAAAVTSFLGQLNFPALKSLGINSALLTTDLLTAITNAPVVKKLEVLDLSGGSLRDKDVDTLIAQKGKLAHLKELNVERCRLSKEGLAKLQAALPAAKGTKQRESGDPEFIFRFVATME
jgi:uncharacterized protein (TIGR02996 family)